jgi:hydrogenase maturation protease
LIRILILAYGNPLRGDDGVAWLAAEELNAKFTVPEVEVVCVQQLAPEMAERVSWADAVIFLDAAEDGLSGEVRCTPLVEPFAAARFSHQLSPIAILALAKQLYGASPLAYSVTLTGQCFDHGDTLSPAAAAALPLLVAKVDALVHQFLAGGYPGLVGQSVHR